VDLAAVVLVVVAEASAGDLAAEAVLAEAAQAAVGRSDIPAVSSNLLTGFC
jgi:hypothetical protein